MISPKFELQIASKIELSGFPGYKEQIELALSSINTELSTDEDFLLAFNQSKMLKRAEMGLKSAKDRALRQNLEVQELFDELDSWGAKVRRIRLDLDKQIKLRKANLRSSAVNEAIESVKRLIDSDFCLLHGLNNQKFYSEDRFKAAISGATIKGLQGRLQGAIDQIQEELVQKNNDVTYRTELISKLPIKHQILFQDRPYLFELPLSDFANKIDSRVEAFEEIEADVENNSEKNIEPEELTESAMEESEENISGAVDVEGNEDILCFLKRYVDVPKKIEEILNENSVSQANIRVYEYAKEVLIQKSGLSNSRMKMFDAIKFASENGDISERQKDYLHFIRKGRNELSHSTDGLDGNEEFILNLSLILMGTILFNDFDE